MRPPNVKPPKIHARRKRVLPLEADAQQLVGVRPQAGARTDAERAALLAAGDHRALYLFERAQRAAAAKKSGVLQGINDTIEQLRVRLLAEQDAGPCSSALASERAERREAGRRRAAAEDLLSPSD